ncbi:MAG: choice-of-anchor B family protein, partial [Phycisphaerae bacterium]
MPACITILTLSAAVAHAGVPLGACCNLAAQTCVDDVPDTACTASGESWFEGLACCEIDCVDAAAGFDASGVALWSRIPVEDFPDDPITGPQTRANEMWGYVSPSGREYAILGLERGAAFVDVTDPQCPVIVAYIEGQGINTIWRDMATFGPYAYIVTDGGGVGLQIVDMTNIDAGVVTLVNTTDLGAGFVDAHNVFVNADTGFLYLCIPNLSAGQGLTVVDLTDPVNPTVAGSWIDTAPGVRCHDVQVVTYTQGPNAGREIAFCFAEDDGLKIADVTDKANMFTVATLVYPNTTYTHQGWLTEDRSFLFIGDELDELQDPDLQVATIGPAGENLVRYAI